MRWVEDTLIKHPEFALPGRKALLKSDMSYDVVLVDATETPIVSLVGSEVYTTPSHCGTRHLSHKNFDSINKKRGVEPRFLNKERKRFLENFEEPLCSSINLDRLPFYLFKVF